ncbi:MAG: FeoA domain protein [Deltaproteobacteria bacterium ADurb.BinA179]|nr:FeoA family protein [Pseudomonadota bacterium]OPZ29762.1 MAG: FeoA domain protein [Deltaproteobacteria bacterium ADurb.BinA179]HNR51270.1 FeoA family protein [Deltaproteobacteria bacterium]HRT44599.1 FeoA family protein [Desulfomonilia bacterium]HNU73645.1 FeoA family protein [Deltaproteobacteria bacterium]
MTLLELKEGDTAVISRISGGKGVLSRMAGLGLHEGKTIRVVQAAPFRGPLLIEDVLSGARTMIGRGVASHVEIRDDKR